MKRVTASDLANAINQLQKDRPYYYVKSNPSQIHIVHVTLPEGPITFKRFNPSKGETLETSDDESISSPLIWRIANAFRPGQPINFDRVLGASYNTRSVFEALVAHTPQFYFCYPGRIEDVNGLTQEKHGHKHIVWLPDSPHEPGSMKEIETEIVISEGPHLEVFYDAVRVPNQFAQPEAEIEIKRRHVQMQIALISIGQALGCRTWIAKNDRGIIYKDRRLGALEGVIPKLEDEKLVSNYPDAVRAGLLIDCIWFRDDKLMPAVIEVEHTTGVTSGLTRMKGFQDALPPFPTRYIITAPDEERDKVLREARRDQFRSMNIRFFPYSAVEEMFSLCQRRALRGVTQDFVDSFLEVAAGG